MKEVLCDWYEKKDITLIILSIVVIFLVLMGLYALSSNITMKRTIGEITYCERVYDTHRDTRYWTASAKFFVDGKEYSGHVDVTSHKYIGQKIMILYNPKDPNDFISQSSTFVGITMIIFGFIFSIPIIQKLKNRQKSKENL